MHYNWRDHFEGEKNDRKPIILTGDRPTGKLHVDVMLGVLKKIYKYCRKKTSIWDVLFFGTDQQHWQIVDHKRCRIDWEYLSCCPVGLDQNKSLSYLLFSNSVAELSVWPLHVVMCCSTELVGTESGSKNRIAQGFGYSRPFGLSVRKRIDMLLLPSQG